MNQLIATYMQNAQPIIRPRYAFMRLSKPKYGFMNESLSRQIGTFFGMM